MEIKWIDQLGDWNPQLSRELKGRLKPRNILIVVAIAIVSQLLLLITANTWLPVAPPIGKYNSPIDNQYCTGKQLHNNLGYAICLRDASGNFVINWPSWWADVFICLSVVGFITLLVVGTYMLISDLSREEQRGTLNFIRLSPQSTASIFSGKLLGVPILLYLFIGLAMPLHLWAGLAAKLPLTLILGFYGLVTASAVCFFSAALLYSLVSSGLGVFQAWLGSGFVLYFLTCITRVHLSPSDSFIQVIHNSMDLLHLFSPSVLLPYLIAASSKRYFSSSNSSLADWQWFGLPLGASPWNVVSFSLLIYGLGIYFAWQGLNRRFHNPSITLISKPQSYLLTACFEVVILGLSSPPRVKIDNFSSTAFKLPGINFDSSQIFDNFGVLIFCNLLLFLFLIAALSPHRQILQDWARYRRQKTSSRLKNLLQDLVWGERSPAIVAILLNLLLVSAILVPWVFVWSDSEDKKAAFFVLLISVNLIAIYACVAQSMLFTKTQKRAFWAASAVAGLITLPPIAFSLLSISPEQSPGVFLFSIFSWVTIKYATLTTICLAVLAQWMILSLLIIKINRQLRLAGESATKALMAGRSLPS